MEKVLDLPLEQLRSYAVATPDSSVPRCGADAGPLTNPLGGRNKIDAEVEVATGLCSVITFEVTLEDVSVAEKLVHLISDTRRRGSGRSAVVVADARSRTMCDGGFISTVSGTEDVV